MRKVYFVLFSTTGSDYKDFVCNTCLKKLNENLEIPDDCRRISKYELAVFARKEECIRKNVAGSFGDCRASEKAVIPFIKPCLVIEDIFLKTFYLLNFTEYNCNNNSRLQWKTCSIEE